MSIDGVIMPEDSGNKDVKEEQKPPAPQEAELRTELARVKGRNKILKVAAGVLFVILTLLAVTGMLIYRRITQATAGLGEALQSFETPFPAGDNSVPGSGNSVYASSMPSSGLGLISGSIPGQDAPSALAVSPQEMGEKALKVMAKYSDRPIVKEFVSDLQKDPEIAKAMSARKGSNPMAMMAGLQNAKGMQKIMMKYATRPDFLKLVIEFTHDPDMKPFMKALPFGIPGQPDDAVSVNIGNAPMQAAGTGEGDSGMVLDTSVISGSQKNAPVTTKKVPLPVDTE